MHTCDLVVEQRESNALKAWNETQEHWKRLRLSLAKRIGKHPDDLVLSRAEEYREKREEYDLLEKATPFHQKHGSEYWQMSLRGLGTRYVPVGNIFSGLFCPVHEDKQVETYVVRVPGSRVPLSKRKDRPKNWRDSAVLKKKHKMLKRRLNVLRPHVVGIENANRLCIGGTDLFQWAEKSSTEFYKQMDEISRAAAKAGVDLGDDVPIVVEEDEEPKGTEDIDPALVKCQGPSLVISASGETATIQPGMPLEEATGQLRLLLEGRVSSKISQNITVVNNGTTAMYYTWTKAEVPSKLSRSSLGSSSKIYCQSTQGIILPGATTDITFSFVSELAGVFTETWVLSTTPKVGCEGEVSFCIRGVAVQEDETRTKRDAIAERLARRAANTAVKEALDDVLSRVKTPPPPPLSKEKRNKRNLQQQMRRELP